MVPEGGIAGKKEELSSNKVAQKQHSGSGYRIQQPVEVERSSAHSAATAAAVAVGRIPSKYGGREAARGDTNRNQSETQS